MSVTLPETSDLLQSFGAALGLGLLVGLQREWVQNRIAGIRTFALVTVFGSLSGLLGMIYGGWVVAAAFLAFACLVVLGHLAEMKQSYLDSGLTTEMAMVWFDGVMTVALRTGDGPWKRRPTKLADAALEILTLLKIDPKVFTQPPRRWKMGDRGG